MSQSPGDGKAVSFQHGTYRGRAIEPRQIGRREHLLGQQRLAERHGRTVSSSGPNDEVHVTRLPAGPTSHFASGCQREPRCLQLRPKLARPFASLGIVEQASRAELAEKPLSRLQKHTLRIIHCALTSIRVLSRSRREEFP